jgi:hypothetical protein
MTQHTVLESNTYAGYQYEIVAVPRTNPKQPAIRRLALSNDDADTLGESGANIYRFLDIGDMTAAQAFADVMDSRHTRH